MNKKTKKRALYGILTQKVKDGLMFGLDDFALKTPKTKDALAVLANISLHDVKLLVVLDKKNDIIEKSLRNIPRVKYIQSTYLNPVDLLEYDKVLFLEEALNHINA
jgi:large subunit ribosomal protein L4